MYIWRYLFCILPCCIQFAKPEETLISTIEKAFKKAPSLKENLPSDWITADNESSITDEMRKGHFQWLNKFANITEVIEDKFAGITGKIEEKVSNITGKIEEKVGNLTEKITTKVGITVNPTDVKFYLLTREDRTPYTINLTDPTSLKNSTYNPQKPTKILAHGWLQNAQDFIDKFTSVYLDEHDINLIFVDWGPYSKNEYEYAATKIVPKIGEAVQILIKNLTDYETPIKKIHLIGFSMGAHVMSHAVKNSTEKISRITGLDPAGPGFVGLLNTHHLTKDDADFVDVIHTNAMGIGIQQEIGHIDFYPNGGQRQPGCASANLVCSHMRCPDLFKESIAAREFYALECQSYEDYLQNKCNSTNEIIMGEYTRKSFGKYFLDTAEKEPFSKGKILNR